MGKNQEPSGRPERPPLPAGCGHQLVKPAVLPVFIRTQRALFAKLASHPATFRECSPCLPSPASYWPKFRCVLATCKPISTAFVTALKHLPAQPVCWSFRSEERRVGKECRV